MALYVVRGTQVLLDWVSTEDTTQPEEGRAAPVPSWTVWTGWTVWTVPPTGSAGLARGSSSTRMGRRAASPPTFHGFHATPNPAPRPCCRRRGGGPPTAACSTRKQGVSGVQDRATGRCPGREGGREMPDRDGEDGAATAETRLTRASPAPARAPERARENRKQRVLIAQPPQQQ
jgi:hypothetical protein